MCNESKGEVLFKKILKDNNILFEQEKKFKNCKNILSLPFDFYLPFHNSCIEINGIQHYESVDFFGGEKCLISTKKRDIIKHEYCKNKNISLIILWKYDYKNGDWKFTDIFNNTNKWLLNILDENNIENITVEKYEKMINLKNK